jgi:hypothetical protein
MAISDLIADLEKYRNASPTSPPANVEQDYSKVAQAVPQEHIAGGLADAFRSNQTPPFAQMLSTLFQNSNPEQKSGILNRLLGSVDPNMMNSGPLSGLKNLLGGSANVTPQQAAQVQPQAVQQLAEHAQKANPSIIEEASQFYAQHPTVVKALGAGALAMIVSHVTRR